MSDKSTTQNVGDVTKPLVISEQAVDLVKRYYGLDVITVSELNSYDDRNFKVVVKNNDGKEEIYVLKIANIMDSENTHNIDVQNQVLMELQKSDLIKVQCPIISIYGNTIELETFLTPVNIKGDLIKRKHAVRLLTYIPGEVLKSAPITVKLAREIGEMIAVLDLELSNLIDRLTNINIGLWNLKNVVRLEEFVYAVRGDTRQNLIKEIVEAFKCEVGANLQTFTKGAIHGDLNEQNIIIQRDESTSVTISGILDWQDMCISYPVFELAITIFYTLTCLTESSDLTETIKSIGRAIIEGYLSKYPLKKEEIRLLPLMVAGRAAQSLCLGEYSYHEIDSSNEYFLTTASVGWKLLDIIWVHNKQEIASCWTEGLI